MLAKAMLNFRKQLKANDITFCYSGYMTEELLLGIGNTLKKQMDSSLLGKRKGKAVFSVFVEQMQNVIRFSAERIKHSGKMDLSYGIMAVGEAGYKVFIAFGSIVNAADAVLFKGKLDQIKQLDKEGLKTLWKETLREENTEARHNVCAGFIDIARRAKGDIEYEFVRITPEWFFFTIKAFL